MNTKTQKVNLFTSRSWGILGSERGYLGIKTQIHKFDLN